LAHHLAHPGEALLELLLRHGAAGVTIEPLETLFDLTLREGGILLAVDAAIAVSVHATKDLIRIHSRPTTLWATSWRASFGLVTIGGATRRTTEAAITARRASWGTVGTTTSGHAAHALRDLSDLFLVDEAVAIAVHPRKPFIRVALGNGSELVLAQFAVLVGVGLLEELEDALAAVISGSSRATRRAGAVSILCASRHCGEQEGTGTETNCM
jgi:hypothetical protein